MGFPMCMQLASKIPKSASLYIYDLASPVLTKFVQQASQKGIENVFIAASAVDVAEKASFIITILPEGKHVKSVYFTPETGILAARNRKNLILVDSSTIDIESSKEVEKAVRQANIGVFLDAPVSGGTLGAEAATLTFMVGCNEQHPLWSTMLPILKTMGQNIIPTGAQALGLITKLANNYLSGINAIATSEAMNFALRYGMDPFVLQRAIAVSSGRNAVNEFMNPVPGVHPNAPPSKNYRGGFKVQLMRKDIGLANQAAENVGARMLLGPQVYQVFCEVEKDPSCFDRDNKVVYRFIGGREDAVPGYPKPDVETN
jgi:3-hydroxyisobutyrate dehydrogenase